MSFLPPCEKGHFEIVTKISEFLNYLIAQMILKPKPPKSINHPIALPERISTPPTRIPAAGPVPALRLDIIRFSPLLSDLCLKLYLRLNILLR
jgi:hypothetical protein